jgi:broad specificity phosphatase PhoE
MKHEIGPAASSKAKFEGREVTTHIFLVRHGHHALLGRVLCGRMPGVHLDELGCQQMEATAQVMRARAPQTIQSSPQRRALQSAGIIAARCGLPIEIVPAFDEIDMGRWTGAAFSDLVDQRAWKQWNDRRARAKPPGGESMVALQRRVVRYIEQFRADQQARVVVVSHAEPIRAALMHYLRVPLDLFHSVDIAPASISCISLDESQTMVARVHGGVTA